MRSKRVSITTTKGFSKNPLYHVWGGMMNRCYNSAHTSYRNYGARGIMVCDRWLDIANFVEDMWPRPPNTSLDRRDNNLDYTPENCRWATDGEQAANQNTNVMIDMGDGRKLHLNAAARETGLFPNALLWRLKHKGTILGERVRARGKTEVKPLLPKSRRTMI